MSTVLDQFDVHDLWIDSVHHRSQSGHLLLERAVQLGCEFFANELSRSAVSLFIKPISLRIGNRGFGLFRHVEELPIQDKVNVFREALDKSVGLGKGGPSFEDEALPEAPIGEEDRQGIANPEILLDDG